MNDKEIILKFLDLIDNSSAYLGEGHAKGYYKAFQDDPIYDFLFKNIPPGRFESILVNLEEEKVLRIIQYPMSHEKAAKRAEEESCFASVDIYVDFEGCYDLQRYYDLTCYLFKKLENFDEYLKNLRNNLQKNEIKQDIEDNPIMYEIEYSVNGEIIIKGLGVLTKTNADSIPDNFFCYVLENSRRLIKLREIEENIKEDITRSIHKVLNDMGFKGNLKKTFFKVSTSNVYFRNPVYKKEFESLHIPPLDLKLLKK